MYDIPFDPDGVVPGRQRVFTGAESERWNEDLPPLEPVERRPPTTHNVSLTERLALAAVDALADSAPDIFTEVTDAEFLRLEKRLRGAVKAVLTRSGINADKITTGRAGN